MRKSALTVLDHTDLSHGWKHLIGDSRRVRVDKGIARVAAFALLLGGCYSGVDADGSGSGDDGETPTSSGEAGEAGDDEDTGSGGQPEEFGCDGQMPEIASRPLVRLSPLQYRNTVEDLFGIEDFDPVYDDAEVIPTERGIRQFRDDARAILSVRDAWTVDVYGCDTSGAADTQCAEAFVERFGPLAFRRPLDDGERARLMDAYDAANAEFGFAEAMDIVLQTMLQSAPFLYLVEEGGSVEGAPDNIRRLTDFEVASRLSYALWDTMPDAELFEAAQAGELTSEAGLRAQVERMLSGERAEAKIQRFVWEWLQLDGGTLHFALEESGKDPDLFPEYGPALQEAMRTEFEALVREVVFESEGASLERLFTDTRAYVNGPLAQLYGVAGGPMDEDTWAWVELDPSQRSGLFTRAAFLSVFASDNVQSPIRRGTFLIEDVFCTPLGAPPPDVDDTPPQGGEGSDDDGQPVTRSVREDVEARTQGEECQACHAVINPAGFLFEHYDAIGRFQTEEVTSGRPIDASGELRVSDVAEALEGAVELSNAMATSVDARECFAEHWLSDLTASGIGGLDDCSKEEIVAQFVETKNVRELIVNIVLSDAFRYLNTEETE